MMRALVDGRPRRSSSTAYSRARSRADSRSVTSSIKAASASRSVRRPAPVRPAERFQPVGGLGPGPLAGDLVDSSRHATRPGDKIAERQVLDGTAGIEHGDSSNGVGLEWSELSALLRRRKPLRQSHYRWRSLSAVRDEQQAWSAHLRAGKAFRVDSRCSRCRVQIVDDDECRSRHVGELREAWIVAASKRRNVHNRGTTAVGLGGQLSGQTSLPDPGWPGQNQGAPMTVTGTSPVPAQPAKLRLATGKGHDWVKRGRKGRGHLPGLLRRSVG